MVVTLYYAQSIWVEDSSVFQLECVMMRVLIEIEIVIILDDEVSIFILEYPNVYVPSFVVQHSLLG